LIGTKIRDNAPIVNTYLYDLAGEGEKKFHVVVIKRGDETIIPQGNAHIESGDILYFTTTKEYVDEVQALTGKKNIDIRKITIMGGSRIAVTLTRLLRNNVRIKLLEKDKEKSFRLAEIVDSDVMVIHGDGRDTDLLTQENIKDCDAFIALTESAETNILACVAAKNLGVPKTVAQVENIDYIRLAEKLDIGMVINKKIIAASHIFQFLLNADVSTVKSLTFANADVAELVARPGSKITRKPVKDLNLPSDITLGGLIRNGVPQIIDGNTLIQPQDLVVVFCLDTAMRKLENYFN